MNKIIFYTIHCPACDCLGDELNNSNVDYCMVDDEDELVKRGLDNKHFPMLEVNGKLMDYAQAMRWAKKVKRN